MAVGRAPWLAPGVGLWPCGGARLAAVSIGRRPTIDPSRKCKCRQMLAATAKAWATASGRQYPIPDTNTGTTCLSPAASGARARARKQSPPEAAKGRCARRCNPARFSSFCVLCLVRSRLPLRGPCQVFRLRKGVFIKPQAALQSFPCPQAENLALWSHGRRERTRHHEKEKEESRGIATQTTNRRGSQTRPLFEYQHPGPDGPNERKKSMTNKSANSPLDLEGDLDGRTLFVMAEVAGLWVRLLVIHSTEDEKELELLRTHNLGVFHGADGLYLDFTAGSSTFPDRRDQEAGMVFYVMPPIQATNSPAVAALLEAFAKLGDSERCNDSDVRHVVVVRLVTSVMAWALDWEQKRSKKVLTA